MSVSVVIGSIRPDTLDRTLAAIQRQDRTDWEVIVVVQGDSPGVTAVVEAFARDDARIRAVHTEPYGLCVARNLGTANASYEIVAMTDDDCEPQPDWLSVIEGAFEADPDLGFLVGSLVAPPPERRGPSRCPEYVPLQAVFDPATTDRFPADAGIVGGNMALRRHVWLRVGPFDERTGPGTRFPAADDVDYLIRMETCRVKVRWAPESVVVHSSGRRYGWKEVWSLVRGYNIAQGAVAAKQTLGGSADGGRWRDHVLDDAILRPVRQLRLHRLPIGVLRWCAFATGYRTCLREYRVGAPGLLMSRDRRRTDSLNVSNPDGQTLTGPAISLIVATRNREKQLARCLAALQALRHDSWELVLVDNGSTDGTALVLEDFASTTDISTVLVHEPRPGLGGARNAGLLAASGAIVSFTDDDCYPDPNFLTDVLDVFAGRPEVDVVAGRILLHDPDDLAVTILTIDHERVFLPRSFVPAGSIQGANFSFRRDALVAIGGFDERLGAGTPFPIEDIDVVAGVVWNGGTAIYSPVPTVYHHHGRRTEEEGRALMEGYDRGRGAYYAKFASRPDARWAYLWHFARAGLSDLYRRHSLRRVRNELRGARQFRRTVKAEPVSAVDPAAQTRRVAAPTRAPNT